MRLAVKSDGTPRGTHVVNAETGNRLEGVVWFELGQSNRSLQTLVLKVNISQSPAETHAADPLTNPTTTNTAPAAGE